MSAAASAPTGMELAANVNSMAATVTDAPMLGERPRSLPMALVRDTVPVVSSISPPRASTPSASSSPNAADKDEEEKGADAAPKFSIGTSEEGARAASAAMASSSAASTASTSSDESNHRVGIKAASKKERSGAQPRVVCCRHGAACKAPRKRMMLVTKSLVERFRAMHPELVISNSGWCCGAYRAQMYRDVSGKPRREKPAPAPVTRSVRIKEAEEAAAARAEREAVEEAARAQREAEAAAYAAAQRRAEREARAAAGRREAEARAQARRARDQASAARRFMTEQRMRDREARDRLRLSVDHHAAYAYILPPVDVPVTPTRFVGLNLLVETALASAGAASAPSAASSVSTTPVSDMTSYTMARTPTSSVDTPPASASDSATATLAYTTPTMAMSVAFPGPASAAIVPDAAGAPTRWQHAAPAPHERSQWVPLQ